MYSLSDLFAYMYFMDLPTLRMVIPEAFRILAERECNAPEALAAGIPANLPVRSHR